MFRGGVMAVSATTDENRTPALVTIVSGALLAIGSFLTWVTVKAEVPAANFSQNVSASGTKVDDGWITLVCGIVAIVAGVMFIQKMAKPRVAAILALIAAAIALVVGLIDFSDASSQVDVPAAVTAAGGSVDASVGIGLYVVLLGGLGALIGGIMLLRSRAAATDTLAPPPATTPPAAS
jgi:hypothetical protein